MEALLARLATVPFLVCIAVGAVRADAVEAGQVVADAKLRRVDGGTAQLLDRAAGATALVFFRAEHERSRETLRMLAACQPRLAGKPVRVVGLVPTDSAGAAPAELEAAGARFPVLVDEDDAVYSALKVRTHPGIAVLDRTRKVLTFEPYHPVSYCDLVVAWIRKALGEIDDAELASAISPVASQLPGKDASDVARRHLAFGRKLLAAGSHAQAHEHARKAIAASSSAEAWWLEGEIFTAERKCEEASRAFETAASRSPAGARPARPACGR